VRPAGAAPVEAYRARGQPWLYCAWHNNTAIAVCRQRNQRIAMMASASRDGELIARAIELLGNMPARCSSSARGSPAVRTMVQAIRRGHNSAITPDGPRGPVYRCQPGALWVGALAGCPLVPYHFEASRQWRLGTWDRHKIPKPFATIHEHYGEPLHVTRAQVAADSSALLAALQQRMLDNTAACLRAAGRGDEAAALSA